MLDSQLANVLPQLVAFGVIGVSVAMMLFAFLLFYKVISQERVSKPKALLSITFLVGALAFLISGGLLQRYMEDPRLTIVLNVTPWSDEFGVKYGQVFVRQGTQKNPLIENAIPLIVKKESEVGLELYTLTEAIDELRDQLSETGNQLAKYQNEKHDDIGYDDQEI